MNAEVIAALATLIPAGAAAVVSIIIAIKANGNAKAAQATAVAASRQAVNAWQNAQVAGTSLTQHLAAHPGSTSS